MLLFWLGPLGLGGERATAQVDERPEAGEQSPPPLRVYTSEVPDNPGIWCDNGLLRVRVSKSGITWFDVYHPTEHRWYVNKNNLNLNTLVPGAGWKSTELEKLVARTEVIALSSERLQMRYYWVFPHGARVYTDMFMERGKAAVRFQLHKDVGSSEITGVQWHITFGQAEAVSHLEFDGHEIAATDLPLPFKGGRLKIQHLQWFNHLDKLDFRFRGQATNERDANNPEWMSRVLGLEQHVTWGRPMRPQDMFAFEARDQPWQPDWGMPETTPWIEGLWFARLGPFLEGDELTYAIENLDDLKTPARETNSR